MKYQVLALALLVSPAVFASPGNDGCVGNCRTTGGGGSAEVNNTVNSNNTQVRVNNSVRDNSVTNEATGGKGGKANSTATGGSVGDTSSRSKSKATGGNATGGNVGDTTSRSKATGGNVGDTSSESNNVNTNDSVAAVGDTSATVGNTVSSSDNSNSNDSQGGDVEFNYTSTTADNAASSAASVLTGYCQTGGSAQGMNGGFTLTGNDQFCDRIRMADYYWIQYSRQVELASAFACNLPVPALADRCVKIGERMLTSLDKAWENTEEANQLLDSGKFAAQVEKATGPFARIGGILALLVLL